jgi:hypothetical protein
MIRSLLALLGRDTDLPADASLHFEWGHLPRGEAGLLVVISLLAAIVLTVWLYRREGSASRGRKALLAGLRIATFAALLVVFLEPRVAVDRTRVLPGNTIVLWDVSDSMSLSDPYREPERRAALASAAGLQDSSDLAALTRHELAWRLIDRAQVLPGLAAKNDLRVYAFGSDASVVPAPFKVEAFKPTQPATDLASALRQALAETGGRNVAGVVVISDGRVNRGEGEAGVVSALEGRGIPCFSLAIGDPIPPLDLAVTELGVEPRVLLGDPIVVETSVRARGLGGESVEVILEVAPQEDETKWTVLERRDWKVPPGGPGDEARQPFQFRHDPEVAGSFVFRVRVPAREDEAYTEDNRRQAPVVVTEEQSRILLVAGSPSTEYHFLRARLTREKASLVSIWLQSASEGYPQPGNIQLEKLPETGDELRELYDAIVLVDPDPDGISPQFAAAIKEFVANDHGGLLFVPGPNHSGRFFQRAEIKPLRDVLPIVPGDLIDFREGAATRRAPMIATLDGGDHPASRLATDPELCRALWGRLPGPFFSYPVLREKAGALVLVRHQLNAAGNTGTRDGTPLLAAHFFQGGPVVFQGTDETWRWRAVAEPLYDKYWVGLLRFLIQGRLSGGRQRVELIADRQVAELGQAIRLRARAYDKSYRPLEAPELVGKTRQGDDESELVFTPVEKRPGWFEAGFLPGRVGNVEISLRLPDDDPGRQPETLSLTVTRSDVEFLETNLNEPLLAGIASATSGGLIAPASLAELPEKIPSRTEVLTVAEPPIALWDDWHSALLIVLLLGLEWGVRKRSKMV